MVELCWVDKWLAGSISVNGVGKALLELLPPCVEWGKVFQGMMVPLVREIVPPFRGRLEKRASKLGESLGMTCLSWSGVTLACFLETICWLGSSRYLLTASPTLIDSSRRSPCLSCWVSSMSAMGKTLVLLETTRVGCEKSLLWICVASIMATIWTLLLIER